MNDRATTNIACALILSAGVIAAWITWGCFDVNAHDKGVAAAREQWWRLANRVVKEEEAYYPNYCAAHIAEGRAISFL